MDIKELSIEQLVEYVNQELLKGRSMVDIETNDFGVNERVIAKRLNRRGYKRVGNEFLQQNNKIKEEVIQKYNESIIVQKKKLIQKNNQSITNEKLKELVELIDPIKEMLEEYNRNKNVIDASTIELKPKAIEEVKQKLFKIDVNVLHKWEEFVSRHKEFKVQQLISLALEEFIQKYN